MLINRVAFCFSSSLNAVPSGPWRCLALEYRRMRAEEMNECVMNGNGTSVCRSREEERLKMKRGRRIREDVRRGGGCPVFCFWGSPRLLVFYCLPHYFTPAHTRIDIYALITMQRSRADVRKTMLSVPAHSSPPSWVWHPLSREEMKGCQH